MHIFKHCMLSKPIVIPTSPDYIMYPVPIVMDLYALTGTKIQLQLLI